MSLKAWEVTIRGVSAFAAVGAVIYGIVEYLDQRKDQITQTGLEIDQKVLENIALVRESKMVFLKKQFDLYVEAVSVVSRLANGYDYARREADLERFWQLYWGELGMVEDPNVEGAMIAIGEILGTIKTSDPPQEIREQLKIASLNLSHCVSKSLEESWGIRFLTRECKFAR